MSRVGLGIAASCALACLIVGACLPGGGPARSEGDDAGAGSSIGVEGDSGFVRGDVDLGDPFALYGLTPSHGPFTGKTTVRLAGRGFTPKLRVFIGEAEVATLAGDPTRAVVVTPAGAPGPVDVRIRDDATGKERVLKKGFVFDAFVVEPDSGATSGGTRITLTNGAGSFPDGAKVLIGGAECKGVTLTAGQLECTTPPGSPGTKDVTVTELDGKTTQARDAFTYSDSPDGYRGGLNGSVFKGTMRVLAFDAATGTPIAGAFAIAGNSLATGVVQKTSASGVTEFNGLPTTKGSMTVTVAAKCHQPMTYVDVPVDTVTAYLPFIADISCAKGDPPSSGGGVGKFGGVVEGELIFPGGAEFQRTGWTTVPAPQKPTERRAAYVFEVSTNPAEVFRLPPANEAITPDAAGGAGYKFSLVTYPGNVSLYIVAGLEDRSDSPPRFVPYAMGVARGISVPTQSRVTGVDVKMDILFDHQITIAPQGVPAPAPRGPDRIATSYALTLGAAGYAILPRGVEVAPLPSPATMPFIGVPSLDHAIAGESYVIGAIAATGSALQFPASLIARRRTVNANDPVALGGFLGVPILDKPGNGPWTGTQVAFSVPNPSPSGVAVPADLVVVQVTSGSGLVTWTIAAPGSAAAGSSYAFDVPDLRALSTTFGESLGLVDGDIATAVHVGTIEGFDYGRMRQGQLTATSWNAHAFDGLNGAY